MSNEAWNGTDYHYLPPNQEQLTPCPPSEWEREYWEDWEQALGMTAQAIRELYNQKWTEEKRQRHQDNINQLHGVFYKGTYYHNP